MKIKKIIEHLRTKPEEEKRHILHLLTLFFSIIIILLWVLSLSKSFSSKEAKINTQINLEPVSQFTDDLSEEIKIFSR